MNILLTGSNGYLGKILKENLILNNTVFELSRSNSDFNFDLTSGVPVFDSYFDLVVHAAGRAHIQNDINFDSFNLTNVIGTKNLLKALEKSGIPKQFVFISSVAVYGRTSGLLITEDTALEADDPYGKSKVFAEELILNWCRIHDITCTILRLPLIVGENPPGNLGAMIEGIRSKYYFNVGGGLARKSMVLGQDVANILLRVGTIGGIYNLTDGYHPSFKELSDYIARQMGIRPPLNLPRTVAYVIAKFGDAIGAGIPITSAKLLKITSDLTFDDSKAREAFCWNPTPVLEGFKITLAE